ncbi:MAG: glutathione binding-like protein [Verrucomicrobiaceae bacterium]
MWASGSSWTDRQGRTIQAEYVSFDPALLKVKLRLSNGTEPVLDLARLCDEDQAWIREHQRQAEEAVAKLKANAGKELSFKSDGPEAVGYHVYFPSSFDGSRLMPLLIVFSPGGNGKGMLGSVKMACEKLGWIGVGCDAFKNGVSESALDPKWQEVLPHIEKTVPHDPDLMYLGGMSGGALRSYDYAEVTVRPWKGVLAFGGWLGGTKALGCPPQMAVAQVKAHAAQKVRLLLEQIDAQLASHQGPWLMGDSYSLIDIYAMMLYRWTRNFEGTKARDLPRVNAWLQTVLARPAVRIVFEREGLPQPWV